MDDYYNTDNSIYENSFSESESEYNRDMSDCNSFKAIKKRSISDLRAKLEMNNKKRYFELLVCENLWLRSNRDMKVFREKLQKIKNHNLLPELPDEILSYNDKDLKEYIKKYFRIGSPLQNRQEDFEEQDNSLDDIFDRKDKNNKITNLYKERLDFDILPFKVSFPRYQLDFVELSKIGSGGFANVYKAKHILDERLYAIKKIFFLEKFLPSLNKVVREVKTLAKLNHKRIVRYYNAWIEKIEDIDTSLEENIIVEENSEICESDIDIESESLRSKEGVIMKYHRTEKATHQQKNDKRPLKNKYLYVLYIQMEMCDNSLRNWLDERKEINEEKNINLMNQLLVAVNHIHENNIMHRDLKPSNCFIQIRSPKMDTSSSSPISSSCANSNSSSSSLDSSPSVHPFSYSTSPLYQSVIPPVSNPSTPVSPNDQKIEIKIGDFGLSKEILDHNQHLFTSLDGFDILDGSIGDLKLLDINRPNFKMEGEDDQEHTSNLGTEYYIAPELSTQSYNQKSDVFSLGIIFFELYNIFQTKMDRAKKLKNLFNGILPQEMLEKYPLASNFILSMVSSDPKERRTIGELLNDEIFKKKETLDEKNIILIQKKTISNLSLQNEELEKKVLKLKNKLKAYKKLLNNTDSANPTNEEK